MSHALAVPLLRVEGHDIWSHAVPISPFENLVKTLKPIPTGFVIQQACAIKHVSNKAFKAGLLTCLVAFNAPTKFHTASSARNDMVGIGSKAQCCLSLRDTFYAQGQDLTSIQKMLFIHQFEDETCTLSFARQTWSPADSAQPTPVKAESNLQAHWVSFF